MGFLGTLFSAFSNKWKVTPEYLEAQDCRGEGHRIRIIRDNGEFTIYPNYQLLKILKSDNEIIMQFSVNGHVLEPRYDMIIKDDHLMVKTLSLVILDFERILDKHGVIQIGLNGISAGMYNDKGYFKD